MIQDTLEYSFPIYGHLSFENVWDGEYLRYFLSVSPKKYDTRILSTILVGLKYYNPESTVFTFFPSEVLKKCDLRQWDIQEHSSPIS